jgi:hypothetical protein
MSEKKEKKEEKIEVEDLETEGEDVKGGASGLQRAAIKEQKSNLRLNKERLNERIKR